MQVQIRLTTNGLVSKPAYSLYHQSLLTLDLHQSIPVGNMHTTTEFPYKDEQQSWSKLNSH